jgi:peptidoglycan/LPS O-acetylase OafA/YrhL
MEFSAPHWERRPSLPALTSLRFFAAMTVVLAHAAADYRFPALRRFLGSGYPAVTFFFVLSGFVLTYAYVNGADGRMNASPGRFWWSRFARIAPAYYVAIALIAPFFLYGFLVAGTIDEPRLWITITSIIAFVPALFVHDIVAWNPPSWSLAVEICLYATLPWLLRPCFRWPLSPTMIAVVATLLFSCGLRAALLRFDPGLTGFLYHFPLFYFPHFALGIVAARYFLFGPKLGEAARSTMFSIGLVSILATGAAGLSWTYADIAFAPLAALVIVGGTSTAVWPARPLGSGPLVILGDASYSIYILHWPLRFYIAQAVKRVPGLATTPAITCALYLAVVLLGALATFFVIERPARLFLIRKASGAFRRPIPE